MQNILSTILTNDGDSLSTICIKMGVDPKLVEFVSNNNIDTAIASITTLRDILLLYKGKGEIIKRAKKKFITKYISADEVLENLTMYENVSVSCPVSSKNDDFVMAKQSSVNGKVYKIVYRPSGSIDLDENVIVFLPSPTDNNLNEYCKHLNLMSSNVAYKQLTCLNMSKYRIMCLYRHYRDLDKYKDYRDFVVNGDDCLRILSIMENGDYDLDTFQIHYNRDSSFFKEILFPETPYVNYKGYTFSSMIDHVLPSVRISSPDSFYGSQYFPGCGYSRDIALINRWISVLQCIDVGTRRIVIINADTRCYSYYKSKNICLYRPDSVEIADKLELNVVRFLDKNDVLLFDPIKMLGQSTSNDSIVKDWSDVFRSEGKLVGACCYGSLSDIKRITVPYKDSYMMALTPHKPFFYCIPKELTFKARNVWSSNSDGVISFVRRKYSCYCDDDSQQLFDNYKERGFDVDYAYCLFYSNLVRNYSFTGGAIISDIWTLINNIRQLVRYFTAKKNKMENNGITVGIQYVRVRNAMGYCNRFLNYVICDYIDSNYHYDDCENLRFFLKGGVKKNNITVFHRNYKTYRSLYKVKDVERQCANLNSVDIQKGDVLDLNDRPENVVNYAFVRRNQVDKDLVEYPKLNVVDNTYKIVEASGYKRKDTTVGEISEDINRARRMAKHKFGYPFVKGVDLNSNFLFGKKNLYDDAQNVRNVVDVARISHNAKTLEFQQKVCDLEF